MTSLALTKGFFSLYKNQKVKINSLCSCVLMTFLSLSFVQSSFTEYREVGGGLKWLRLTAVQFSFLQFCHYFNPQATLWTLQGRWATFWFIPVSNQPHFHRQTFSSHISFLNLEARSVTDWEKQHRPRLTGIWHQQCFPKDWTILSMLKN